MNGLLSKREIGVHHADGSRPTYNMKKRRSPTMNNWSIRSGEALVRCFSTRRRLLLYLLGLLVVFTLVSSMYNLASLSKSQKLVEDSRHPVESGMLFEDRRVKPKRYCADEREQGNFYINHFRDAVERLEFSLGRGGDETSSKTTADSTLKNVTSASEVLVIADSKQSDNGIAIMHVLTALRISYRKEFLRRSAASVLAFTTPILTDVFNRPRFAAILFDSFDTYKQLEPSVRYDIDAYCKTNRVGMILFASASNGHDREPSNPAQSKQAQLDYPVRLEAETHRVAHFQLASRSSLFTVSKAGTSWTEERFTNDGEQPQANDARAPEPDSGSFGWAALRADVVSRHLFEPLAFGVSEDFVPFTAVLYDRGAFDGIERVIFGSSISATWLHTLLVMDALSALTRHHTRESPLSGVLSLGTERFVLVDIDDMFVAAQGTRITRADVSALLDTQRRIRDSGLVADFHFNVGFCGKFFERGTDAENDGDHAVLENHAEFWWFDHSWSHYQPHLARNATQLLAETNLNRLFAEKHGIVVDWQYAVAPHHSGVYPVHQALFDAWRQIGVRVTSTEEYPHLRPARLRRGFVHSGIQVLPRQTCGLYTHTLRADELKDGFANLIKMIEGGEVLQTLLLNPISVFMTHMPNYGSDRLGLFLFESVFNFIACNTNLRLRTVRPVELAQRYFQLFPEDRELLWTNPCDDNRHLDIWPSSIPHPLTDIDKFLHVRNMYSVHSAVGSTAADSSPSDAAGLTSVSKLPQSCYNLPNVLIIGPQKTGTTALYSFLKQHPAVRSNSPANDTFEETQFFSNVQKYSVGGLPFYQSFFENRLEYALLNVFSEVMNESEATLANLRMSKQLEAKLAFIEKRWQLRLFEHGIDVSNRTLLLNTPVETWNDIIDHVTDRRPLAMVEKSATYFDNELTPSRVAQLLPRARLIAVLINPIDRAYSWYQHTRSKSEVAASNFTFAQVLTVDFNFDSPPNEYKGLRDTIERIWPTELRRLVADNKSLLHRVRQLRNRCLEPGHYAMHIENWLRHFEPHQLHLVDGKQLREQPIKTMQTVQKFLRLSPVLDYSTVLRFNEKKGFYCVVERNGDGERVNCLGKSKGRAYQPLDALSEAYLRIYFTPHNAQLLKLLRRLRATVPLWLQAE